jgi:hypothetical protein
MGIGSTSLMIQDLNHAGHRPQSNACSNNRFAHFAGVFLSWSVVANRSKAEILSLILGSSWVYGGHQAEFMQLMAGKYHQRLTPTASQI